MTRFRLADLAGPIATHLVVVLVVVATSFKKLKAPSIQIWSAWNLAGMFFT